MFVNMMKPFFGYLAGMVLAVLPMIGSAQTNESESVDKYRKSYNFSMPDPGKPENGGFTPVVVADNGNTESGIFYQIDPKVQKLLDVHKRNNENMGEVAGFRIQIYAGGDQALANEARADFVSKFSKEAYEIHQTWDPPHFRVRVGDFRTRAEAMRALPNIRRIFPDGFVVADKVNVRKMKRPSVTGTTTPDQGSQSEEN